MYESGYRLQDNFETLRMHNQWHGISKKKAKSIAKSLLYENQNVRNILGFKNNIIYYYIAENLDDIPNISPNDLNVVDPRDRNNPEVLEQTQNILVIPKPINNINYKLRKKQLATILIDRNVNLTLNELLKQYRLKDLKVWVKKPLIKKYIEFEKIRPDKEKNDIYYNFINYDIMNNDIEIN